MKLKAVEVTEFQSVRKSNEFDVSDITCLVGKNEAGKTAILQALYRLNPLIPSEGNFDVTDDYPRAEVEDYQQEVEKGKRKPATVIKTVFEIEENVIEAIENDFGTGVLVRQELVLYKGYENEQAIKLFIDERCFVQSLVAAAQLPKPLATKLSKLTTLKDLSSATQEEKTGNTTDERLDNLKNSISKVQVNGSIDRFIFDKYLKPHLPRFLYFDEYYMMRGQENIEALKSRVAQDKLLPSDRPLLGLLELARLSLEQLINVDRTETLINKLEGAGNHLSKRVLKYWSQNKHLQMKFDVRPARPGDPDGMTQGTNLYARVYDSKHSVTTPLGSRSRGFVWFFSFLAWFDQQQKKEQPLILLLDEPGLFLHGKAQGDLLRYIEQELGERHQVIYTTHSPFMVDPKRFDRVRIVQDVSAMSDHYESDEVEGTKVLSDVLDATEDSLFPLQGALGYEIHQSLFVGPYNLVVEGASDLLYLQTISGILSSKGRTGLDPRWTITPVGGAGKVPTYVALLGAQKGLTVVTLLDIQKKDRQVIEDLYKRKLLKKQNVITFADFLDEDEGDIEDMFDEDFYLQLVNAEYSPHLTKPITMDELTSQSPRIIVKLDSYFSDNPMSNSTSFGHYRPARYFTENATKLEKKLSSKTIDRFESMFARVNALI